MITPHQVAQESPTDELALFLVGDKKAGKSYIAATAPGNILFLDFDQRLSALRSHPNARNIYGLTFSDSTDSKTPPTAFNDLLSVLNQIEKSPRLSNWFSLPEGKNDVIDTIVLDSIQTISDAARAYVLFYAGATDELSRNFAIGGRIYRVPRSYAAWGSEIEMVTSAVLQARAFLHCTKCWQSVTGMSGGQMWHTNDKTQKYDHPPLPKAMNVICTLHEAPEEDERSTEKNPIFTGKIVVYPTRYHRLLVYFNEVWRVVREHGRVPQVRCDPDGKFIQAATALGVPSITAPDISQVLTHARSLRRQPTQTSPIVPIAKTTPTTTNQPTQPSLQTKPNGDTKNAKS